MCHRDDQGRTALHLAAGYGSEKVVKKLLQEGLDPNEVDKQMWTTLRFAEGGKNGNGKYIQVVKLLLCAGANATILDQSSIPVFAAAPNRDLKDLLQKSFAKQILANDPGTT